ncbi:hypothetical protein J7L67_01920 [bacterium]|nr:hypothetical protein [bacterium]
MTFKSLVQDDLKNVFLNTNEFAEEIVYMPKNGTAKTIVALISRDRIEPVEENRYRSLQKECEVIISKLDSNGISSINEGQDKVSFPEYEGGSNKDWAVLEILKADTVTWTLRVGM